MRTFTVVYHVTTVARKTPLGLIVVEFYGPGSELLYAKARRAIRFGSAAARQSERRNVGVQNTHATA